MASASSVCPKKEDQGAVKEGKHYLQLVINDPDSDTSTVLHLNVIQYEGDEESLYEWENFYLPETVKMQVIGIVKDQSLPEDGLVLMTCEDKKVYAFDGDELHLVAEELQLIEGKGVITYPGSKAYYRGETFKDMTNEDWDKIKRSDFGKRLAEEHLKLVKELEPEMVEILKSLRRKESSNDTSY